MGSRHFKCRFCLVITMIAVFMWNARGRHNRNGPDTDQILTNEQYIYKQRVY